jgi:hypothetical protein
MPASPDNKNTKKMASTAELVPVQAVLPERRDGEGALVIMRDGSFRLLLKASTVNFEMKSPAEQQGITYAFGELADSLDTSCPIQIVSHAKQLDTDAYVRQFDRRLSDPNVPQAMRRLMQAHIEYFESTVKTQNLQQREVYIVIPYRGVGPSNVTASVFDQIPFSGLFRKFFENAERRLVEYTPSDEEISLAWQTLDQRSEEIIARLAQMQVRARRLGEEEIRNLLYELYHPGLAQVQKDAGQHTDGRLVPGFSAEAPPPGRRRRLSDGSPIDFPAGF